MFRSLLLRLVAALSCTVPGALAAPLTGGDFSLTGSLGTGPETVQGGTFEMDGVLGDPYGGTSTGGEFVLMGGWFAAADSEAEVRLTVRLRGEGSVEITWPENAVGYRLEVSSLAGAVPGWESVVPAPFGHSYIATADAAGRYFRLRRP